MENNVKMVQAQIKAFNKALSRAKAKGSLTDVLNNINDLIDYDRMTHKMFAKAGKGYLESLTPEELLAYSADVEYAKELIDVGNWAKKVDISGASDPVSFLWKMFDTLKAAGLAFYSVLLHESLITEQMYESYLTEESLIGGEPCMRDCEWVEASTGSLGHGLPVAVGMAIALKSNKSHAKVYVMLGDGECQEGSVWESMIVAASMKLNNLVVILDNNKIQKMDLTENTMGTPDWEEKFASFGFEVRTVNGHDVESFVKTVKRNNDTDKPLCIIADTVKGKGVSIMENNPNWHFKLPGRKDLKVFKQELGISDEELL